MGESCGSRPRIFRAPRDPDTFAMLEVAPPEGSKHYKPIRSLEVYFHRRIWYILIFNQLELCKNELANIHLNVNDAYDANMSHLSSHRFITYGAGIRT